MKDLKITVNDSIIDSVQEVIESSGMDIEMVIKMVLNRIVREQSISFLISNEISKQTINSINSESSVFTKSSNNLTNDNIVQDMRKSYAISLFRSKGIMFSDNITYASKNRTAHNYWANPNFDRLEREWFLILNDWINRVLYLFIIPSRSISKSDLVARSDQNNQIDLQILYNDASFRDTRSNFMFKKFLIMSEKY